MKAFVFLSLFFFLAGAQASSAEKIFCSVAGAWKGALVYEWDTYRYTQSVDECLCLARNEVIGTRFENEIGKVRVLYSYSGSETVHRKVYTVEQLKVERACDRIKP